MESVQDSVRLEIAGMKKFYVIITGESLEKSKVSFGQLFCSISRHMLLCVIIWE